MINIDWSKIDDYLFVKLVGELLARLGFVDIEHQGEGPDGGIDLFATELIPFTVQGRIPFRWAIQCKFSVNGMAVSVNDSEIKDVEGIISSDRYSTQDPRGYLLITNRKIVQNVVERLRGIDRKSRFRTARIDGSHLETLLSDQGQLVERVFGEAELVPHGLGQPDAIILPTDGSGRSSPPRLPIEIRAHPKATPLKMIAIVDTGASSTCIPLRLVNSLGLSQMGIVHIATPSGREVAKTYHVEIGIERLGYFIEQAVGLIRFCSAAIFCRSFPFSFTGMVE